MRSKTLHALAEMAKKDPAGVSEILRALAIMQGAIDKLGQLDELKREAEGWQRAAKEREEARAEEETRRVAVLAALGDGWHPLQCGGAVLLKGGEPVRVRIGQTTDCPRESVRCNVRALGFEYEYSERVPGSGEVVWDANGEAAIRICNDLPAF